MMAMFGAIFVAHPRHVLFAFWVWVSLRPLIYQISANSFSRSANYFFVALIIVIAAGGYAQRRTDSSGQVGIQRIFTALMGVTLLSFVVNRSSPLSAVLFFVNYLAFPFVFYVAYTTLDRRHWRYLFGAIIGLTLIQFALNVGWRLGINPLPNQWSGTLNIYDIAQGTFANCAHVAYFMVAAFFLLISALRLGKKCRPKIILLLGIVVLQLYMTYTNHAYIFLVILLPVYLIISKQSMRARMAAVAIIILGTMTFSFLSEFDESNRTVKMSATSMLSEENLQDRWDRFIHGPKIEILSSVVVKNATKEPMLWLLGNGPGNGLSGVGMKHSSAFAWETLGKYVVNTMSFKESDMSSISGSFYSGILSIWSELGVVGYLLYLIGYMYAVWRVARKLIKNEYRDIFQRVLAEGFVMAMLMFIFASFLQDIFSHLYFTCGLWIWAAMVWDPVEPEGPEDGDRRTEIRGRKTEVVDRKSQWAEAR